MAGAYCRFCGRRCFVLRVVPDGPSKGWEGHLATCQGGMAHDLNVVGHTHLTAINPITDPERASMARPPAARATKGGPMTRYKVYLTGYALASLTVEAEDEDAAIEEALNSVPGLCAQCSGYGQDWGLEVTGEWDCREPEVVLAEGVAPGEEG